MAKKYKKPTKLSDVSRSEKRDRLQKVATGSSKFYADLRRKAKVANQRLVRLERADKKSPAYLAVQAKLEILGREAGKTKGRRFSETGKATYNEYQALSKVLDEFIAQKTSTVKGYTDYVNEVWRGALKSENIDVDLKKAGITKEQWLEMMLFFNFECAYSGEKISRKEVRTVDHIVALDNGGLNEIWNCVPMYANYNYSKHTKDMEQWYRQQDFFSEDRLVKIYQWIEYAYEKWGNIEE